MMINLPVEPLSWQLDMQLTGKLALSAAAAVVLLALAFRYFKSRTAGRDELRGSAREDGCGITSKGKQDAQTRQKRGASSQGSELRLRQININAVPPGTRKDPEQSRHSDGTVTMETWRTCSNGHEWGQSLTNEQKGLGARQTATWPQNGEEPIVVERQVGATNAVLTSDPADAAVPLGRAEGSYFGGKQPLPDQAAQRIQADSDPVGNSTEQGEVLLGSSACEKSNGAHAEQHSTCCKPEPTLPDYPTHPAPSQNPDTRQEPEGEDMRRSLVLTREAGATREGLWTAKASSGINRSHESANGVSSFSSIAEVQVEEKFIKERQTEGDGQAPRLPQGGLKGKVYHYFVESTSESVSEERSRSSRPTGTHPLVLHSKVHEGHLNSASGSHLLQDQAVHDSGKEAATDSSRKLLSSGGHKGDLESGPPDGTYQTGDSPWALQKQQVCQQDFIKTGNIQKITEDHGLLVEGQSQSSSLNSSTSDPRLPELVDLSPGFITTLSDSLHSTQARPNTSPSAEAATGVHFFQVPLDPQSARDICLDLGNCYSALKMAKEHQLDGLKEAAYKFMSDHYLQVLQSPAIYGHLNPMERELILEKRMKGRRYVTVADVDTHAHSPLSPKRFSRLCYYDDEGNSWNMLTSLPAEAVTSGCAMGTMFNYLFVVAGCEGPGRQKKPSNRVFCYNPLTGVWKEISPLNQARPHCKLVELDGSLYAIGGECQHTVEQYDPRRDRWSFATPLPNDTFAIAHMATMCEDKIYVTGGTLRYMLLSYSPKDRAWKSSLISGSRDRTTEMVAVSSFLYRFDLNRSMGISVHRCNVRARLWYECASHRMPYPASFQCAVLDNHIHCVSRQFHLRLLADDVSPRFMDKGLEGFPTPQGSLYPFVLALPDEKVAQLGA